MADERIAAGAARSPLGASAPSPHVVASGAAVEVSEWPFAVQVGVRAQPGVAASTTVAGMLRLPSTPNRVAVADGVRAMWLAPDEWLVLGPAGFEAAIDDAFRTVDVSAHRTLLEIRGRDARALLARGCPMDLDARSFRPDQCAQTLLARVDVILFRLDGPDAFGVLVRASFARYLVAWLTDAIEGLDA